MVDLDNFKPVLGVLLGLFVFVFYTTLQDVKQIYQRWLTIILFSSVAAFIFQGVVYYLTDHVLKLVLIASGEPRVWYGGGISRIALRLRILYGAK